MRVTRWFLMLVFMGLSASLVMADGVDPKVKLKGGGGSTGLLTLDDPNFKGTVFGGTIPLPFDFINATGQVAIGVNLFVTLLPNTPDLTFSCEQLSVYFTNCSVTPLGATQTALIRFFGPNNGEGGFGGIPSATDISCPDGIHSCSTKTAGADFAVQVLDVNGDLLHLTSNEGFSFQGTLVAPEPSTILLVLTGGVLVLFFKRF